MMKQIKSTPTKLANVEPNALNIPGATTPYPLELTESDWLGYAAKLAEALQEKTKSLHLSVNESARFTMNCELIRRVGIGNEIRNYVILEIHQTKQWRPDFKTIKDFAAIMPPMPLFLRRKVPGHNRIADSGTGPSYEQLPFLAARPDMHRNLGLLKDQKRGASSRSAALQDLFTLCPPFLPV